MTPTFITVRDKLYCDTTVHLDGYWFTDCTFDNCTLLFSGEKPFGYDRTVKIDNCRFAITGVAELAIKTVFEMVGPEILVALAIKPSIPGFSN